MEKRNVVLIVLDTMRKDYADKYIWPVLKKYGFVKYDRAIAPAPWTLPSHASMLTGLYPSQHKSVVSKTKRFASFSQLSQEYFLQKHLQGRKLLVTANPYLSKTTGFLFFDKYIETLKGFVFLTVLLDKKDRERYTKILKKYFGAKEPAGGSMFSYLKRALVLLREKEVVLLLKLVLNLIYMNLNVILDIIVKKLTGISWPKDKGVTLTIKHLKNEKIESYSFIFVNLMEVHEPYTRNFVTTGYNKAIFLGDVNGELWRSRYKEFSVYLANKLETLLKIILSIKSSNTLIIITSDHGQMLGEHGVWGHGRFLYDELIRVPLYIRYPQKINLVEGDNKWISLKNLKNFILRFVEGNLESDSILYEDYALSETFYTTEVQNGEVIKKYVHRIAVYYKDYKGIFNVDEWKWECWKTYNDEKEVPEEAKKEMMKIVVKHLRMAVVKDKAKKLVPKKLVPKKGASS